MEKYKLTEETKEYNGRILHRIQALIEFADVKAGDLGGWVEGEHNLSHYGSCWVSENAMVYGNARVSEDALVYGDARVSEDAWVYGKSRVYGDAWVNGNAWVYGIAQVSEDAWVYDNKDFICIFPIGSKNDSITFYKTKDSIGVVTGCFNGSIDTFEKEIQETHGNNEYAEQYRAVIELVKNRIK